MMLATGDKATGGNYLAEVTGKLVGANRDLHSEILALTLLPYLLPPSLPLRSLKHFLIN